MDTGRNSARLKKTVPCAFLTGMHYLCGTILFVGSYSVGDETPGVQIFY